jgi:hypothetical protein
MTSTDYWMHGGLAALILGLGAWLNRHLKYIKARINGYTIEKKEK